MFNAAMLLITDQLPWAMVQSDSPASTTWPDALASTLEPVLLVLLAGAVAVLGAARLVCGPFAWTIDQSESRG